MSAQKMGRLLLFWEVLREVCEKMLSLNSAVQYTYTLEISPEKCVCGGGGQYTIRAPFEGGGHAPSFDITVLGGYVGWGGG